MPLEADQADPRTRRDHGLAVFMLIFMVGGLATAATLAVLTPPDFRLLVRNPALFLFEAGSFVLIEGLFICLVPSFLRASVRHFSLTFSNETVTQFDVFRFRRVKARWHEIAALEDVGGALWITSPAERIALGTGLDWKDPAGLIEYVEERVRPEVEHVSKKQ